MADGGEGESQEIFFFLSHILRDVHMGMGVRV